MEERIDRAGALAAMCAGSRGRLSWSPHNAGRACLGMLSDRLVPPIPARTTEYRCNGYVPQGRAGSLEFSGARSFFPADVYGERVSRRNNKVEGVIMIVSFATVPLGVLAAGFNDIPPQFLALWVIGLIFIFDHSAFSDGFGR